MVFHLAVFFVVFLGASKNLCCPAPSRDMAKAMGFRRGGNCNGIFYPPFAEKLMDSGNQGPTNWFLLKEAGVRRERKPDCFFLVWYLA